MPRLRCQIGGAGPVSGDWSCTFEFLLSDAIASQAVLQTIANTLMTQMAGVANIPASLGTDTTIRTAKLLYYPTNTGTASLVASSTGAAITGGAIPVHCPQVAVVASLRTAVAGRSGRGRVFWPYRSSNIAASGVVNTTGQTLINGAVAGVVSSMGVALAGQSISGSWVVWSPKLGVGNSITSVLIGNQCDTIRHRNDNRAEVYHAFAVTPLTVEVPDDDPDAESIQERLNAVANRAFGPITGPPAPVSHILQGIIGGAVLVEAEGLDSESAQPQTEEPDPPVS